MHWQIYLQHLLTPGHSCISIQHYYKHDCQFLLWKKIVCKIFPKQYPFERQYKSFITSHKFLSIINQCTSDDSQEMGDLL